jgi:hypothetical protein
VASISRPGGGCPARLGGRAAVRRYLEQVARSLRPGSVSNADQALRAFAGFLHQSAPEVVSVAAVVRGHIEAYKVRILPGTPRPPLAPHERDR